MLTKIGWTLGIVYSAAAFLSIIDGTLSLDSIYNQWGLFVAHWHAGGLNMFDNFAFKQWQIDSLSRKANG